MNVIFDPDEHTDLVFWSRFLMYDSKNITFSNPDELLVISNHDSKINQYDLSLYILQFRKIWELKLLIGNMSVIFDPNEPRSI